MVGQPHQNFMKMASWSSVSEHLVNPIGMSDQLKWNNQSIWLSPYPKDFFNPLISKKIITSPPMLVLPNYIIAK